MPGYRKSRRSLNPLPYGRQYLPPLPGNFAPWPMGMHHLWYPAVQPHGGIGAMFQYPGLPLLPHNYFTVSASLGIMPPYLVHSLSPYISKSLLKEDCTVTQLHGNVKDTQEGGNFYQSENDPTHVTVNDETITSDSSEDSAESGITDNNPTNLFNDATASCVICLDEEATKPCKCETCTAVCCYICIDEWLKNAGSCPMCRSEWDILIEPL